MTGQLRITEIIRQYAPRAFKANQYSRRNRYSMACPLPGYQGDRQHPDGSGSFSVDETDNLYKCFGCGATGNARRLHQILSGAVSPPQEPRKEASPSKSPSRPRQALQGVTIQQLAPLRGLDPAYLRQELRWRDVRYFDTPAIRIPYFDEEMAHPIMRFRVGLDREPRFRWQKFARGEELRPYGLWTLDRIRKLGWCLLVEGETDFAVLSYHDFPVLGIPGATSYQAVWNRYLKGISLYVWREPGAGGEAFIRKISQQFKKVMVVTSQYKDACELARALTVGP